MFPQAKSHLKLHFRESALFTSDKVLLSAQKSSKGLVPTIYQSSWLQGHRRLLDISLATTLLATETELIYFAFAMSVSWIPTQCCTCQRQSTCYVFNSNV